MPGFFPKISLFRSNLSFIMSARGLSSAITKKMLREEGFEIIGNLSKRSSEKEILEGFIRISKIEGETKALIEGDKSYFKTKDFNVYEKIFAPLFEKVELANSLHYCRFLNDVTEIWLQHLLRHQGPKAEVMIHEKNYLASYCVNFIQRTKCSPSLDELQAAINKGVGSRKWESFPSLKEITPYFPDGNKLFAPAEQRIV